MSARSPVSVLDARTFWGSDRRLDAEHYLTPGYQIRSQVEGWPKGTSPLGEIASVKMPGRLSAIQVDRQHGVAFLTATQAFDIRPRPRKWLAPTRTPELADRKAEPGVILVTRSGIVGETIMSYSPHKGVILSDDLLRVRALDPADQSFLYAYLRTSYATAILRSTKYGNMIKHLEPEHLSDIPVPDVSDSLRRSLDAKVKKVYALRDEALSLIDSAEGRYVTALGLKEPPLASEDAYVIDAEEMFSGSRRLDGYHYNPEAEAALHALQTAGKKTVPLGSVVERVFGVPRFKHVYTASGIPYVDSEDLFKVNPTLEKFIPPGAKKNAEAYFVKRDWLLMACSGQIYGLNGSVVHASEWHEKKIISNHVLRIETSAGGLRPGYLQLALSHSVFGRPLVIRYAFGTEVPEISPEDVQRIPIPDPSSAVEKEIADSVERATELRIQADRLEATAVAGLEAALAEAIGPPAAGIASKPSVVAAD